MSPVRTFQVNPRLSRTGHLPAGHVTSGQLKADIARGTDYFYSRRPHLHRTDGGSFLDFRRHRPAA